jgi:hypothetical protein
VESPYPILLNLTIHLHYSLTELGIALYLVVLFTLLLLFAGRFYVFIQMGPARGGSLLVNKHSSLNIK